jgi:hypothetical protein
MLAIWRVQKSNAVIKLGRPMKQRPQRLDKNKICPSERAEGDRRQCNHSQSKTRREQWQMPITNCCSTLIAMSPVKLLPRDRLIAIEWRIDVNPTRDLVTRLFNAKTCRSGPAGAVWLVESCTSRIEHEVESTFWSTGWAKIQ